MLYPRRSGAFADESSLKINFCVAYQRVFLHLTGRSRAFLLSGFTTLYLLAVCVTVIRTLRPSMVEEMQVYVQAERLKTCMTFPEDRFVNSLTTSRGGANLFFFIIGGLLLIGVLLFVGQKTSYLNSTNEDARYLSGLGVTPGEQHIETEELRYAGLGWRCMAYAVDYLILAAYLWLASYLVAKILTYNLSFYTPSEYIADFRSGFYVLAWFLCWPYFAFFESSKWQATPGKMLFGLIVTDKDGQRINGGIASVRYVTRITDIVIVTLLMVLFTQRKQTLHDVIAGTVVLRAGGMSKTGVVQSLVCLKSQPQRIGLISLALSILSFPPEFFLKYPYDRLIAFSFIWLIVSLFFTVAGEPITRATKRLIQASNNGVQRIVLWVKAGEKP